jgi:hypothetical protein
MKGFRRSGSREVKVSDERRAMDDGRDARCPLGRI